jgi:hypothetical protein
VGLTERLTLARVRVDEVGDLRGLRLPIVDQLSLCDLLPHTVADQVNADHCAALELYELNLAGCPQKSNRQYLWIKIF